MNHTLLGQDKENQYFSKLPSLEFKPTTKKRVLKKPSPSKSSKSNNTQKDNLKINNYNHLVPRGIFRSTVSPIRENTSPLEQNSPSNVEYGNQNDNIIKRGEHRRLTSEYDSRKVRRVSKQINMGPNLTPNIINKVGPSLTERSHVKRLKTSNAQMGSGKHQYKCKQIQRNQCENVGFRNQNLNQFDIRTADNNNFSQAFNQSFHQIPDGLQQGTMRSNKQFYKTFSGHQLNLQGHTRNKSEGLNLAASANYCEQIFKINNHQGTKQNKQFNFIKNKKIQLLAKTMSLNSEIQQFNDPTRKIKLSHFQLGLCKGEDFFGKTYPARHIQSGFILCIKEVSKRQVKNELQKLLQYLKILSSCNHQNVIQMYGVFEERNKIFILMEYFEQGDLFLHLKSKNGIDIKSSLNYLKNIAQSLRQLHKKGIVYRNFKPQNLSFIHDTCKISNFAWSCRIENQKNHYQGAIEYCSPQLLLGSKYTKKCDIWGLGVLLYQLINGVTPCHNLSRKKSTHKILNQNMLKNCVSSHLSRLIQRMLKKQPELRMTVQQLLAQIDLIQTELDSH